MPRRPSSILVEFDEKFLEQIDAVARAEMRTRVDLIREALRRYFANRPAPKRELPIHD